MPAALIWSYLHQDFREPHLPDGSPILRPSVVVSTTEATAEFRGVVDSGSPLTVADPAFLAEAGVDAAQDTPVMEVPLGLGTGFSEVALYEVELVLLPPAGILSPPLRWTSLVGARTGWRLPFAVLLGQRGWFDRFPTTIDGSRTTVHL